jgi:D-sedoheptulose 7-phosphate isomerase
MKLQITNHINLTQEILKRDDILTKIELISEQIVKAFQNSNKLYFCGNGGSSADSLHLAAEFSGRFYFNRDALPAEALHSNIAYVTAVANDYSFEDIFSRQVKGNLKSGDILFALSTSGNSKNIIKAFEAAKNKNIFTIAIIGEAKTELNKLANLIINIPSSDTPRIQEVSMLIGHIICEIVESKFI